MKRILLYVGFIVLLFSCSSNELQEPEADNFYALTVGNSWVYKWYNVNTDASSDFFNGITESVSIVGTETINDELYYKFKYIVSGNDAPENQVFPSNGEYYKFYRDSLGYLINEMGEITFNTHPTEEILASYQEFQTLITVYGTTNENSVDFLTEAGAFNCVEMIKRHEWENGFVNPGMNYSYYSQGVGLISDDIVFASNNSSRYQRRLNSYNVQ